MRGDFQALVVGIAILVWLENGRRNDLDPQVFALRLPVTVALILGLGSFRAARILCRWQATWAA